MNIKDKNIDILLKSGIENESVFFDKETGWKHLSLKRKSVNQRNSILTSLTILMLSGLLSLPFLTKLKRSDYISNEFQKRQKLKEYESIMSGTYEELYLCHDCNGTIIKSQIKEVTRNHF